MKDNKNNKLVYSTNHNHKEETNDDSAATLPKNQQLLKVQISKKDRGGKTATVINGFVGSEENLNGLGKMLKTRLGVGGAVKEGEIIIQGNFTDKIIEILIKEGYKAKKSGG